MEQATAQALRAGEIIRRMRDFVRFGESDKANENATAVLLDAAYLAAVAAKYSGVAVEQDFAECGEVLVDKIQIQQVVLNLARNAIEAMATSPKKVLTLKLTPLQGREEFSVSDTGVGISKAMTERLFVHFRRPRTAAWASVYRSAGKSSKPMMERSGPRQTSTAARSFGSRCR
jgi:signal transduction histidine kinase